MELKQTGGAESQLKRERALQELCGRYWPPIYAYVRRSGYGEDDAEDVTQGFFAMVLRKQVMEKADAAKGTFRGFLLGALRHFLVDEYRSRTSAKRGGKQGVVTIDPASVEAWLGGDGEEPNGNGNGNTGDDAERAFDRAWASAVIGSARAMLEERYVGRGKAALFERIGPFLFATTGTATYDAVGEALGMSRGAVAMAVKRMRERFGEIITEEVARTLPEGADVKEELSYLLSVFAKEG